MDLQKLGLYMFKLSGEYLHIHQKKALFDKNIIEKLGKDLNVLQSRGYQFAIVMGGGNIIRGESTHFLPRISADQMGMLATVINALSISAIFQSMGIRTRILSAVEIPGFVERYTQEKAVRALAENCILLLSGGMGHPYFSTDSAAALRAIELNALALIKGTKVRGVYSDDPLRNPEATFYPHISYQTLLTTKSGNIMDLTAVALCAKFNMPIAVFSLTDGLVNLFNGSPVQYTKIGA